MTITNKPWGYEELLVCNDNYALKKLVIRDDQRLSLQFHLRKRETWYVQSGEGAATLGTTLLSLEPGKVVDIPAGVQHRAYAGKGRGDLVIIEASTPQLDDIFRVEDDYGRA